MFQSIDAITSEDVPANRQESLERE